MFDKVAETNPYLRILASLRNCRKRTLLKVLRYLTRSGWLIASSTKGSFVRKAQTGRLTLLLDEADAFLQQNEEMQNVLDDASDPATATTTYRSDAGAAGDGLTIGGSDLTDHIVGDNALIRLAALFQGRCH